MKKQEELSWADIKAMYAETDRLFKELAEERKETDRQLKELAENSKETDRQLKELAEDSKERLDRLGKYLGGVSNSNGDMAEEYFYNTLNRDRKFANETFDKVKRNVCYDENDNEIECDILMINGKSTVLIEVKYNARLNNIKLEDLIDRANILKQTKIHKNHNIYLGVAAMSFNKKLAREIRQAGIATIHHTGKKMVLYDKEVKIF
jgi:hypothetical protein